MSSSFSCFSMLAAASAIVLASAVYFCCRPVRMHMDLDTNMKLSLIHI